MSAVCVGLVDLDVVQRLSATPRWGLKEVSIGQELVAGGPAANAAVTAARLLGSATLVTALGETPAADVVRADLFAHGVEIVDMAADDPDWQVPVSSVLVGPDGERTCISPGAPAGRFALGPAGAAAVLAASVVLLDGHHPRAAREALDLARESGARIRTVLDAGSPKDHVESWLPDIDVAAASADYAAGLGLTAEQAVDHLLESGANAAIVTQGAGPVRWREPSASAGMGTVQPGSVVARDTVGAGDAFHGALVAGLVHRPTDLAYAVRLATRVATTRVASIGAREWLADLIPLT